jgi:hypothetical protein
METFLSIIRIPAYIISAWTVLALLVDTLDVVFSRDITSIGWYASHPLSIWKLGVGTNVFAGLLVWLAAFAITFMTATFLL